MVGFVYVVVVTLPSILFNFIGNFVVVALALDNGHPYNMA